MMWKPIRLKPVCAWKPVAFKLKSLLWGCPGNIHVEFWVLLMMLMMGVPSPACSHPCSSNTPHAHTPARTAHAQYGDGGGWPGPRGTQRCTSPRTGQPVIFFFSLSLTLILCVSLSLPPLLLSPTNLTSLGRLEPTSRSKRSEEEKWRRLVLFDRRAVSRVEAAWNNAVAEVGGGIRRRDYHPSTCWIRSISRGAFTSMWERLQTGNLVYFRVIVASLGVNWGLATFSNSRLS